MKEAGGMAEHDDHIMTNSLDELKKKAFDSFGSLSPEILVCMGEGNPRFLSFHLPSVMPAMFHRTSIFIRLPHLEKKPRNPDSLPHSGHIFIHR